MQPSRPEWRPLGAGDLAVLSRIAGEVHPAFPEDDAVFAERLALYPAGCRLLAGEGAALGYVIAHPWMRSGCPALNSLIGALPRGADTLYIHDLALLPQARGTGAAAGIVAVLKDLARSDGLLALSLIAVNGSAPFWQRQGFRPADAADPAKLASYGGDASFMTAFT